MVLKERCFVPATGYWSTYYTLNDSQYLVIRDFIHPEASREVFVVLKDDVDDQLNVWGQWTPVPKPNIWKE